MQTENDADRPDVNALKKMVRLLEGRRRVFMENDWKKYDSTLPKSQFNQLMLIRFAMPCNLGRIMEITGLTSPGASLFVDKLVQKGILFRKDDRHDRRNVRISLTRKGQEYLKDVDERLDRFVFQYVETCTAEELRTVAKAVGIICRKLEENI